MQSQSVYKSVAPEDMARFLSTTRVGNRATLAAGVILASCGLLSAGVYIDHTYRPQILNNNNGSLSTSDDPVYPNIMVLYVMVGILTGIGFGFTYLPLMTVRQIF